MCLLVALKIEKFVDRFRENITKVLVLLQKKGPRNLLIGRKKEHEFCLSVARKNNEFRRSVAGENCKICCSVARKKSREVRNRSRENITKFVSRSW